MRWGLCIVGRCEVGFGFCGCCHALGYLHFFSVDVSNALLD